MNHIVSCQLHLEAENNLPFSFSFPNRKQAGFWLAHAASSVGICLGLGTLCVTCLCLCSLNRESGALAQLFYPHQGTGFAVLGVTPHRNYSFWLRVSQGICSETGLVGVGAWGPIRVGTISTVLESCMFLWVWEPEHPRHKHLTGDMFLQNSIMFFFFKNNCTCSVLKTFIEESPKGTIKVELSLVPPPTHNLMYVIRLSGDIIIS